MNEKLRCYIDDLFANAPSTVRAVELKEELYQNLTDKYNDLIAQGKSEESAYNIAIASIGDVDSLISGLSGEKQVAIGHGQEYIRLSGIVNPYFVNASNTIASSQVADARIEYKESGAISEAQVIGWLARFFLTFLPF